MGRAKAIEIRPIDRADAVRIVKNLHYSGTVMKNSQLHFGVFLDGRCGGALQFGPSLDKKKIIGLVADTPWQGFLELNRMALADWLPPNSESRSISVCCRLIQKAYPHVQWIVSFADGTQCGHGTIYQASGFVLTAINESKNLVRLPSGRTVHKLSLESSPLLGRAELGGRSYFDITGGKYDLAAYVRETGGEVIPGYQLRYLKFLDPTARDRLTVPVIPFSEIEACGASMYRGEKLCVGGADGGTTGIQPGGGGSIPTPTLSVTEEAA